MLGIAIDTFFVISPILIVVGIGYFAGKWDWVKENAVDSLTKIVFYIGLPALLIDEISRADISSLLELKGPLVVFLVTIIVAVIGYVSAVMKKLPASQIGVWSQASFRANMGFIGFPMVLNALGDQGVHYCSLDLAIGVPILNIVSVIVLYLPHREKSGGIPYRKMFNGVLTNPLVIACFVGVLYSFVRPEKLPVIDPILKSLKNMTFPIALLIIGLKLEVRKSISLLLPNFLPLFYKLIITPVIGGILLYLLDAEPLDYVSAVLLLASPVAVISYIMAAEMKGDAKLAANLILSSTFFSFFSFSFILFILGILGKWKSP